MKTFEIGIVIRSAWESFKKHFLFLWMTLGIAWGISIFLGLLDRRTEEAAILNVFITIGSVGISLIVQLGVIRILLSIATKDTESGLEELFLQYDKAWRYLGASLLYGLGVMLGLLLLIVPGVYFFLKYQFFSYLIVDENLGVFEAFGKSGAITEGSKWKLLGLCLALIGINIIGAMALGAGLLVTIPVSMLAYAHTYRTLVSRLDAGTPSGISEEIPMVSDQDQSVEKKTE